MCHPEPDNRVVIFEPNRSRMVDLYGPSVDHPDFVHAFRLVLDAWGRESLHLRDLQDFTTVHVNPKLRNLRFETYAVVAPLPNIFRV